jgi:short-chain fatty acids transporter
MSAADLPSSRDFRDAPPGPPEAPDGALARFAARLTDLAERYIPDAFVFALLATAVVWALALLVTDTPALELVKIWGDGFWELIGFTMQMALIVITGYVVATAPVVYRAIVWLSGAPRSERGAVALVALFSMVSAWINWGLSLVFSAMLAREIARRMRHVDYRALCAAVFMGLGSVWAQGLSGSAALQMATPGALPGSIRDVVAHGGAVPSGLLGLEHTIFLWQSLLSVAVEIPLVTLVFYLATPTGARARSAAALGVELGASGQAVAEPERRNVPGEWLEHTRALNLLFVAFAGVYLSLTFARSPNPLGAINFNTINLFFLSVGALLHGTPARLMRAVREATPAIWAILLQYPFYAGIAALISKTHLNAQLAGFFVSISSRASFPALIAAYSALLGIFVPSGGSKWVIEAPYVLQAAHELKVHLGFMVAVYDLGEALANLVQPFWMVPVLGLLGLRARDVMGFTFLIFLVLTPVVLVLVTVLAATLPYPL